MTLLPRHLIRLALFSLLPCFLVSVALNVSEGLPPASAQELPADAASISRDLLFLAPTQIERRETSGSLSLEFLAGKFTYVHPIVTEDKLSGVPGGEWQIEPASHGPVEADSDRRKKFSFSLGDENYALTATSDDERATVTLWRKSAPGPLAEAVVWTREELAPAWLRFVRRQHPGVTAASLRENLEVADPVLEDVAAAKGFVWVALGHSRGEGELGIGTVVRFDLAEKQASVFHPAELATCDITDLATGPSDTLFLGTRTHWEGTISTCAGLVKFHPSNGQVEKIAVAGTPLANSIVTALRATERGGWVATDSGICTFAPDAAATCWRIVPMVSVKSATPVVNRPGEKGTDQLPPGEYEVLWANAGFLEVATKDSLDAWLAADDFADAATRHFDAEPFKLLNIAGPPGLIRLLVKPGGDPLGGAILYRAPLEKLSIPAGTPAGWVRVRARIGWIPRGDLAVVPKFVPVEAAP